MSESLELCPFCGSDPDIYSSELHNEGEIYWIRCDNCEIAQHGFYTKEDAIKKWNSRV